MINSSEYIRLVAFLKRFDCNNREAATYIACLQMGMASVQEIAHHLSTNRVTVHSNIEQLIKKGLLFETKKGKKRFIVAESPDVLSRILQRKMNELKLVENDLDPITKLLHSIQSEDRNFYNVRFYEGVEGFKKIMEEMLGATNDLCVFACEELFDEAINVQYLRDFYKRLAQQNVHSRVVCAPGEYVSQFKDDQIQYKLQLRLMQLPKDCMSSFYLWNDSITLSSFKDDRIICTVIQNQDMAFFFRNVIFESFWNSARSV